MYAAIRHPLVKSVEEFTQKVKEDLVPDLEKLPGFSEFYIFRISDEELVSITVFDTKEQAEESNRHALDWIRDKVSDMVISGPNPIVGELTLSVAAKPSEFSVKQSI